MDAGNERDLAQAYAQHREDLKRYLRRLLGDDALADDLSQEAGLKLLRAGRSESIREPRAWLFHAGANLARDALRKRMTWDAASASLEHQSQHGPATPDELASIAQDLGALGRAIEQLPPQARRILLMARVEGRSYKEIARELGIASKTVENHLGRAVARLAQSLGRRDGGQ